LDAGAAPVLPVVGTGDRADTVTYSGVWPGVDVVYTVRSTAVKEDIVVRQADRAEFPFVADGLDAQAGRISLQPAEVLDGAGRIADRQALPATARLPVAAGGHRERLVVGVDHAWLAGQLATEGGGPVIVDPTVVIGNSIHQSYKSDG